MKKDAKQNTASEDRCATNPKIQKKYAKQNTASEDRYTTNL